MSRRRKYKKRKPYYYRRKRPRRKVKLFKMRNFKPDLKPETWRGIIIVFLIALCLISVLSFFGLSGAFGKKWLEVLKVLFGWGAYVVPFIVAGLAFSASNPERFGVRFGNFLGGFLLILSLLTFFHLFFSAEDALDIAAEGRGGGYFGLLSYPLRIYLGLVASFIIVIALFLISVLMTLSISLKDVWNFFGAIFEKIRWQRTQKIKEKEEEEKGKETVPEEKKEKKEFAFKKHSLIGEKKEEEEIEKASLDIAKPATYFKDKTYRKPPFDLLSDVTTKPKSGDIKVNAHIIERTLANFGIKVTMGDVKVGPTVTQFTLKPEEGVKLSKITALHNDLALALAAHPIRIEAPIPGKSLVGIEVPNKAVSIVRLRPILEDKTFQESAHLVFGLGRDVSGNIIFADIDKMPHLLICGATGSGKTIAINSLIISLVYKNPPSLLKFILVDPKRVELSVYNGIPHLLTPVITDTDKIVNALRWTVGEMERRYELLSKNHHRDIDSYNRSFKEKLPYLLLIIDELADIMASHGREVEGVIARLAQLARAVGIHLILATQRPSVDVITGLIKANITSRIAFAVASSVDSRTVLDVSGAERLLGNGDMLFMSSDHSKPKRIQGAYISEDEIKRLVSFLKKTSTPEYNEEITEITKGEVISPNGEIVDDELFEEAKKVVLNAGKGSASLLQRRLRIGYARAARLLDLLETKGIVGPADGSKPREVLSREESEDFYSENEESDYNKDAN